MKIHVGPTIRPCCSGTGQLHLMAPVGLARGLLGTRSVFIKMSVNSYLVRVSLITVKSIALRFHLCLFGVEFLCLSLIEMSLILIAKDCVVDF